MFRRIAFAGALLAVALAPRALAHDTWADGTEVPGWIKKACCDKSDAHRLTPGQIQKVEGGWRVAGYADIVTAEPQPSADQYVWIFYRTNNDGSQSHPFCFFVPWGGV